LIVSQGPRLEAKVKTAMLAESRGKCRESKVSGEVRVIHERGPTWD